MSEQPENPKAFPHFQASNRKCVGEVGGQPMYQVTDEKAVEGMDLRDYFAAKALPALIQSNKDFILARGNDYKINVQNTAKEAYEYADAMLKERAKK